MEFERLVDKLFEAGRGWKIGQRVLFYPNKDRLHPVEGILVGVNRPSEPGEWTTYLVRPNRSAYPGKELPRGVEDGVYEVYREFIRNPEIKSSPASIKSKLHAEVVRKALNGATYRDLLQVMKEVTGKADHQTLNNVFHRVGDWSGPWKPIRGYVEPQGWITRIGTPGKYVYQTTEVGRRALEDYDRRHAQFGVEDLNSELEDS